MKKCYENATILEQNAQNIYGLNEEILMENAAFSMACYLKKFKKTLAKNIVKIPVQKFFRKSVKIKPVLLIVCGSGNNGGDGYALARLLQKDFKVHLYEGRPPKTLLCILQSKRCETLGIKRYFQMPKRCVDILVDCFLGAGLKNPLDKNAQNIIYQMNCKKAFKIACDLPSGLFDGFLSQNEIFKTDVTLTMGCLKTALVNDHAKDAVGKIKTLTLGLSTKKLQKDCKTNIFVLEKSDFVPPKRMHQNAHKGNFGHAVFVAGEKVGASLISAKTAFYFGSGLVSVLTKKKYLASRHLELMFCEKMPLKATAIGYGSGLGHKTQKNVQKLAQPHFLKTILNSHLPTVLDADALVAPFLKEFLAQKRRTLILTPHPKEFVVLWENLFGEKLDVAQIVSDKINLAKRLSKIYPSITLVLKGCNTVVAQKGLIWVNPFSNPALAKAGSGDTLVGFIISLLCQGKAPLDAALQGTLALSLYSKKAIKKKHNFAFGANVLWRTLQR